jgi:hypothetical protein
MPITSIGSSNCLCVPRASVPEVRGVRIGTVASLALRYYARAVSTRRVVLVSLVVASACLGLAAAYTDGSWRVLWLNLLAEAVGVVFIVPFVAVAPTELAPADASPQHHVQMSAERA